MSHLFLVSRFLGLAIINTYRNLLANMGGFGGDGWLPHTGRRKRGPYMRCVNRSETDDPSAYLRPVKNLALHARSAGTPARALHISPITSGPYILLVEDDPRTLAQTTTR